MSDRSPLIIFVTVITALLIGLGGGYTWYWNQLADGLHDGLEVWLGKRRAEGFVAETRDVNVEGFPFQVNIGVDQLVLGRGDMRARDISKGRIWRLRGADLTAEISPFDPTEARIELRGPQIFSYIDRAGQRRTVKGQATSAHGVIQLSAAGQISAFSATFDGLVLSGSALTVPLAMDRLKAEAKITDALEISAQADRLRLPEGTDQALGDVIDIARLDATLSGELPLSWTRASVSAWRDQGGVIDITRARIKWSSLNLEGGGKITLDDALRPKVTGRAQVRGHAETIAAYQKSGLIKPLNAAALTVALSLMGRDGEGNISMPLSVRKGRLHVGPVPVAKLQALKFPKE